jgi:hypothetical protein
MRYTGIEVCVGMVYTHSVVRQGAVKNGTFAFYLTLEGGEVCVYAVVIMLF